MKPRPQAAISLQAASDLWSDHYSKCTVKSAELILDDDASTRRMAERDLAVYVCDKCGWETPAFYVGDDW